MELGEIVVDDALLWVLFSLLAVLIFGLILVVVAWIRRKPKSI